MASRIIPIVNPAMAAGIKPPLSGGITTRELNGDAVVLEGVCTGLVIMAVVLFVGVSVVSPALVVPVDWEEVGTEEVGTEVLVESGIDVIVTEVAVVVTDMSGLSKEVVRRMLWLWSEVRGITRLSVGVGLIMALSEVRVIPLSDGVIKLVIVIALSEGVIRLIIDVAGILIVVDTVT